MLDSVEAGNIETPTFGIDTPDFGNEHPMAEEVMEHFGSGEVLFRSDEIWPRFPTLVLRDLVSERILVGEELKRKLHEPLLSAAS